MTTIIVLLLLAIIISLFTGFYFLMKDEGDSKRTVNALSWRVGLQLLLIVVLVVAFLMGKIRPHGVFPNQNPTPAEVGSTSAPDGGDKKTGD